MSAIMHRERKTLLYQARAFRLAFAQGESTQKLLRSILLETIAAIDASGGALYLQETDDLIPFGDIDSRKINRQKIKSWLEKFDASNSDFMIEKPTQLATPLWLHGQVAGAIYVSDPQIESGEAVFSTHSKAIFTAFATTASIILERSVLLAENLQLKSQINDVDIPAIVGESVAIEAVKERVKFITAQELNVTVLIQGESGVGKEIIARAIYENGFRKDKNYIVVNCAALPENLIESELFGHEKGAFTGAINNREGKISAANGGTLFLDEIGEMPLELQSKLLRVLEDGSYSPIGSNKVYKSDFQLISATNKDLKVEVEAGKFREDLYYRLKTVALEIPPLRERTEDIGRLARHFIRVLNSKNKSKKIKDITPRAITQLRKSVWPGNVRELKHVIESAYIFCNNNLIDVEHLPEEVRYPAHGHSLTFENVEPLEKAIGRYVKFAFDKTGGKTNETMRLLKIDHRRLQRYLQARNEKWLTLPMEERAELKALKEAEELILDAKLSKKQAVAVKRSIIEAIINAVEHSEDSNGKIKLHFLVTPRKFKITVEDEGVGFDQTKIKPIKSIEEKVKNGETRGWGLHIINKSMDDVKIDSGNAGTKIIMAINRN